MIFDKVKECADGLDISIREVERRAGLENGTISKWRTSVPRADNLAAVAKVLGKSVEYFLDESKQS